MNDLITYYAVVPTTNRDWLKKLNNANDLYISIIGWFRVNLVTCLLFLVDPNINKNISILKKNNYVWKNFSIG